MSEEQERILVCADWSAKGVLKNRVKANCKFCKKEVGYDPKNAMRVEADHYQFACLECFMDKFVNGVEPGVWGGSLVGGQMYADLLDGAKAAYHRKDTEDKDDS
jgi:hypothetical protein